MKLKDILSRVTSKDPATKGVAMRELLEVKRKHPQMFDKYLHATQDRFRTYIEDSLRDMADAGGEVSYGATTNAPAARQAAIPSVDNLAERLAKLKQRSHM